MRGQRAGRHSTASAGGRAQPKYLELANLFVARIESGEWKPGDQLPSFAQLREQYGVSRPTAERMLGLLDQRGLIERHAGAGIFVARRASQPARNGIIGLCGWGFLDGGGTSYWTRLTEGIQQAARSSDSQVLLLDRELGKGWEKVDGMLISRGTDGKVDALLPPGMPHVRLFYPHPQSASVVADEGAGMRDAVDHLVGLGHVRIAYLSAHGQSELIARVDGYHAALRSTGIVAEEAWTRALSGKNDFGLQFTAAGQRDMAAWLADTGPTGWAATGCTALLCHNDETAVGAMRALRQAGLRVPEDVSVVGFDNVEASQYCTPTLSTVSMPLGEIGATAVEMLQQQIAADTVRIERRILPTRFIQRESTGPAPRNE